MLLALDDLLRVLEQRAQKDIEKRREEAKREVERIIDEAHQEAELAERMKIRKLEAAFKSESAGIVYRAKLEAKNELIVAQEEVVSEAFELAKKRLAGLAESDDYPGILESLLQECLQTTQGEEVELAVRDEDRELVEDLLRDSSARVRFSDTGLDCMGGLEVRTVDGKLSVRNTFESRLDNAKESMRREIAVTLFGESDLGDRMEEM